MELSNLTIILPRQIEVVSSSGQHLRWFDEETARQWVDAGKARPVMKAGRVRVLVALIAMSADVETFRDERGQFITPSATALDKTRYSLNHETRENPARVWTLKRLPKKDREIYTAVLDGCRAA